MDFSLEQVNESQALREIRTGRRQRRLLSFAVIAVTGLCLVFWGVSVEKSAHFSLVGAQVAVAEQVKPQDVWQQVYQRLPDLPKENQYISKETGAIAVNNTLVSRLVRYHLYVKSRTPRYRLDWKFTLADYLGANDYLVDYQYPGYDSLRQNPLDGDRAAIGRLSRSQREALIDVLVNIFNPDYNKESTPAPSPSPLAQPSLTPPSPPQTTTFPKPGSADLLKP